MDGLFVLPRTLSPETVRKIGEQFRERKAQHMIDAPYLWPLLEQIGTKDCPHFERRLGPEVEEA